MNFFRRKRARVKEDTYKHRVTFFWHWWSENAVRIRTSVDADGGSSIHSEISEQVNKLGPSFAWVLGPHPDGKEAGHSFTLSPEGILDYLFLTNYWLERAPETEGWHFYSSRQPSDQLDGAAIQIGELELTAKELWLAPNIDEENREIDLVAWSPVFAEIGERASLQVLFLLLDEALGENGVSQWLGKIEIGDHKLAESFPLTELPEQLEQTQRKHGWEKCPLGEGFTLYRFNDQKTEKPRQDLLTLNTQNPSITLAYAREGGPVEDPVGGTGARYQFIQMPVSQFPEEKRVDTRAQIEDILIERLDTEHSGRVLGGGLGTSFVYIDLLIFDGSSSEKLITEVLDQCEVRKFSVLTFTR